jgi:outer membrane receptor for ferrienterochelin and colicins
VRIVALALASLDAAQAQRPDGDPPDVTPVDEPRPGRPGAERGEAPKLLDRVEIRANRATEERRQSTAAKIVIEREEIEQYGDNSVAETLRRLPGITTGGRAGRGGEIRMRGMGSGYTQILVNGERMPQGFSLDTLPPDQVERIEIMRAPSAEFGARAVAGTVNVVLREPLQKQLNELRVAAATERGLVRPQISWTRNDALGDNGAYNFTLSAARGERRDDINNRSLAEDLDTGETVLDQQETGTSREQRDSVQFNGRLRWRFADGSLALTPFASASRTQGEASRDLVQTVGATPPPYAHADSQADAQFTMARINAQGQLQLAEDTRLEIRGYVGGARWSSDGTRQE